MTTTQDWERTLELTYSHMATKAQVMTLEQKMDVRFDALECRMDERFTTLEGRVDSIETKLDRVLAHLGIEPVESVGSSTRLEVWVARYVSPLFFCVTIGGGFPQAESLADPAGGVLHLPRHR